MAEWLISEDGTAVFNIGQSRRAYIALVDKENTKKDFQWIIKLDDQVVSKPFGSLESAKQALASLFIGGQKWRVIRKKIDEQTDG